MTGKVNADWTKVVTRNGVTSAVVTTVAEVSGQAGYYSSSLTPDALGSWTVTLSITVSGYTYRFSESFTVETAAQADPAAYIAAGNVAILSPVADDLAVTLYESDSYDADESRALEWSTTDAGTWPTLTSATIAFRAVHEQTGKTISAAGSVVTATGATKQVRVELAPSDTLGKPDGEYAYQVIATLSNAHVVTLAAGTMTITKRLRV